jgi:hypothetical protein
MKHPSLLTSKTIVIEPGYDESVEVVIDNPNQRLKRLLISHEIADHFMMTKLSFGGRDQMLSSSGVPAALFSTEAAPEDYDFDVLGNGPVKISATNTSGEPRPFSVVLVMGVFLKDLSFPSPRRNFLGFGSTLIPAGASADIGAKPTRSFYGARLVVPSAMTEHFAVSGIRCNFTEQLSFAMTTSPVPAMVFSEKAPQIGRHGFDLDRVRPHEFLTIQIHNTSRDAHNFSCAFTGMFDDA